MSYLYTGTWTGKYNSSTRDFQGFADFWITETATQYTIHVKNRGIRKTSKYECTWSKGQDRYVKTWWNGNSITSNSADSAVSWGEDSNISKTLATNEVTKTYNKGNSRSNITFTVQGGYSSSGHAWYGSAKKSWTYTIKAKTITVSYNANGGSGAPSSQSCENNKKMTVSSVVPTRENYTFLGWSTGASATSASYSKGGSFTPTSGSNVTLYAVWKPNITPKTAINIESYRVNEVGEDPLNPTLANGGKIGFVKFQLADGLNVDLSSIMVAFSESATSHYIGGYEQSGDWYYCYADGIELESQDTLAITIWVTSVDNIADITEHTEYTTTSSSTISPEVYVWDAYSGTTSDNEQVTSFCVGGVADDTIGTFNVENMQLGDGIKSLLCDFIYPVGSIYMSLDVTSPSTLFGGTWERIGVGRTLVSAGGDADAVVDSNTYTGRGNIDVKTTCFPVGQTGGELDHTLSTSEMPSHTHKLGTYWSDGSGSAEAYTMSSKRIRANIRTSDSTGGGGKHNNVPPYLTVYMWKRTV